MIPQQLSNAASNLGAVANSLGGLADSLINMVPTPGKLVMIPVKDFSTIPEPTGPPYIAMFNPENWQTKTEVQYHDKSTAGDKGAEKDFDKVKAPSLSFDLVIDGTGASGQIREVLADVKFLEKVVLFNGAIHQPNRIFVIWGTQIFKGVVVNMTVKYTLFRPNGIPLRAIVTLEFLEHKPKQEMILDMNLLSADLTHQRLVKTNDRLDLICHYIYADSRHYIEVAKANQLTSFRKLPVGATLTFPPIEK